MYDQEELGLIDKLPDANPNMADIQIPLHHEVWSRSRGHYLSKSDLWTPCVVDIAIRPVPKPCYPDLAEESRKPP